MKRLFIKLIILAMVVIVPQSCSDDYLDVNPTNAVSEADVFTNTDNAWGALNGIHRFLYAQFEGRQSHAGQSGFMIQNEMMGEDLVNHTTGNGWFIALHRWTAHRNDNSWETFLSWRFYYQIIGNANMIIKYIDDAEGAPSDKENILGQALAYRAWSYWNLVQTYAKRYDWTNVPNNQMGVPLVLEPTDEGLPRESVENVYAQINADLTQAITLLEGKTPPASSGAPKSHITADVAKGIKARVAITMGDWPTAAQLANQVRQGKPLMTPAQLLGGFSDMANPEFLWVSHVQEDQTTYFYSFFAYMSWNFSSTNIRQNPKKINQLLYEMIPDTDIRKQQFAATAEDARQRQPNTSFAVAPMQAFKFLAVAEADSRGDLCHMRTAEMYLIEAEALARQGGQDGQAAQVLYDLVITRDPEYQLSTNTGAALIEEIMTHRRIELWGEGFRWLDLKRLNLPLDRTGSNHDASVAIKMEEPAGTNLWQYLITRDEINANANMVQNEL
jgi:hypothetical protein